MLDAVVDSLACAVQHNRTVDDLADSGDGSNQRKDNAHNRTAPCTRCARNGEDEVNQENDGFDARGAQVEDGLELVHGRENDFDDGEQEAQARECYDDAICCSVRGRDVSWDT